MKDKAVGSFLRLRLRKKAPPRQVTEHNLLLLAVFFCIIGTILRTDEVIGFTTLFKG